ncbi:MAG: TrlF family AAA-like ATPase [Candidatus Eremiobacterota bacterium]
MPKGSCWNIWDFHLHTPFSILNNKFGDPSNDATWENYINQIEVKVKKHRISAIGFTDYFSIEGYKKISEFRDRTFLKDIFIFPNIEFRADKIIYPNKDHKPKRLNFHVLLSPELSSEEMEEGFLHDLDFVYENEPFETSKMRKLKISNLTAFGKILQEQHEKFRDQSEFYTGCLNAVVNIQQIKECLENRFKGKYLLVIADENLNLLTWDGQDHATRKQLLQMSHAVFSSNEKMREFCLGKTDTKQNFINEFKTLKPCIWGCDSHGFNERFLEPDQRRFCWLKGKSTWEGLKQILYEPEDRLRINENNPEPDKSIYSIDRFEITQTKINDKLSIDNFQLSLNPNLVTIIGGRGSGKTALLDLIATCFQEGSKLKSDYMKHSFFYRLYVGENPKKRPTSKPIEVNISFKSGETLNKNIGFDEDYFSKANIIYLTQNHFDEYSSNPDKLNKHVIDLIFGKYIDDRSKYDEMENEIKEFEKKIQTINLLIEQLSTEVNGKKDKEEENLQLKEGEKLDYIKRIDDIKQKQGTSDDFILNLTQQLEQLKTKKRTSESLLCKLSELLIDLTSFYSRYREKAIDINSDFKNFFVDNDQVKSFPDELNDIKVLSVLITHNDTTLNQYKSKIENDIQDIQKKIGEFQGISKTIAAFSQKLSDIYAEINEIKNRIKDISDKEQKIVNLNQERFSIYANIMKKMMELRSFIQNVIGNFETGKDEMLSSLKFSALIDMEKSRNFIETLATKVDNRAHSEECLKQDFTPIFEDMDRLMNSNDSNVDFSVVTHAIRDIGIKLKLKKTINNSDFYNMLLYKFWNIGLKIEFNNKVLSDLSMGERAIALLKILLALDDKPLLIDQPEEHLDNRYIYDELIPAFRSAKTRRQIIIATHNANLVVNTDAEQIIIAEHSKGILSYKIGMLEDLKIRESIKSILEGGDEAFKKREEKYGYKF